MQFPSRYLIVPVLFLFALLVCSPVSVTHPAQAAGLWYVAKNGNDSNNCAAPSTPCASINGALSKSGFVAGDTVRVAAGTYAGTGPEVVLLNKNANLSGGWDTAFVSQVGASTIDGQQTRRGVTIIANVSPSTVVMDHFAIQNGYDESVGGGIWVSHSSLTFRYGSINGNAASSGGGIGAYDATLAVEYSSIANNSSARGAGIYVIGQSLVLTHSTVSGNTSGVEATGNTRIENSTISGNPGGEGIVFTDTRNEMSISNSTISNNRFGLVTVNGNVTFRNSILANNGTGDQGVDCNNGTAEPFYYSVVSLGHNIVQGNTNCVRDPTDLLDLDPMLGPLQNYGGPTLTQALLPGSPAINAGDPEGCRGSDGILSTDQRGYPRPGRCDIGAFEAEALSYVSVKTVDRSAASKGDALTYRIVITNTGATQTTPFSVKDTLPVSLAYTQGSLAASTGSYAYNAGVITWSGSLNAGQAVNISYQATIKQALGPIMNSAVINGGGETITRAAQVRVHTEMCNLSKYGGNPVLRPGPAGSWDSAGVLHPTILKDGDIYKMWYTGIDAGGMRRIGYATSDGFNWTKYGGNPVLFPPNDSGYWSGGIFAVDVIRSQDDYWKYYIYYSARDKNGINHIGFGKSTDGISWGIGGASNWPETMWLLELGPTGSWDDASHMAPTVLKRRDLFHMWYTGSDGVNSRVGHATVPDLYSLWSEDPLNPVLNLGSPGGWDSQNVYAPSILTVGNNYVLLYSGDKSSTGKTGYATSFDLVNWVRQGKLISEGTLGSFDEISADFASATFDGSGFQLWYSGLSATGQQSIGYARADICNGDILPLAAPPPPATSTPTPTPTPTRTSTPTSTATPAGAPPVPGTPPAQNLFLPYIIKPAPVTPP